MWAGIREANNIGKVVEAAFSCKERKLLNTRHLVVVLEISRLNQRKYLPYILIIIRKERLTGKLIISNFLSF